MIYQDSEHQNTISGGANRLERWQDDVHCICGGFETHTQEDISNFVGRIELKKIVNFEFASIKTNALSLRKRKNHLHSEDGKDFFLIYQKSGSSTLLQRNKEALLRTGDFALIDSRYTSEFHYLEESHHLSFHVPCNVLEQRLRNGSARVCETLTGQSPVGNVIAGFIQQISARHELFEGYEGTAMEEALITLLAPIADDNESLGKNLSDYARVTAYIDQRLKDELNHEEIARAVGTSVRSLYRLFEGKQQTLGNYIRDCRLEKCAEQLRSQSNSHESVTHIAYRWGFRDSSHFSRAFKAKFELSPRQYRYLV